MTTSHVSRRWIRTRKLVSTACAFTIAVLFNMRAASADICGIEDYQDVEDYDGSYSSDGFTIELVDRLEPNVGMLCLMEGGATDPNEIGGGYFPNGKCSGTLIGPDLFLTAGHCPVVWWNVVAFNYQIIGADHGGNGVDKRPVTYVGLVYDSQGIVDMVESGFTFDPELDYKIVRLAQYMPTWTRTCPENVDIGDRLASIHHPMMAPKKFNTGLVIDSDLLAMGYLTYDIDIENVSSGSCVLGPYENIVAINADSACSTSGYNIGIGMDWILQYSVAINDLNQNINFCLVSLPPVRFFEAISHIKYIYMGCPDPPTPWFDENVFEDIRKDFTQIEEPQVLLASIEDDDALGKIAVPKDLREKDAVAAGLLHMIVDKTSGRLVALGYGVGAKNGDVPLTGGFGMAQIPPKAGQGWPETDALVAFGGSLQDGRMSGTLWVGSYNGLDDEGSPRFLWHRVDHEGEEPPPRSGSSVYYDTDQKRIVVFGGMDQNGDALNDAWAFYPDKNRWYQISSSPDLPALSFAFLFRDGERTLIAGGLDAMGEPNTAIYEIDDSFKYSRELGSSLFGPGFRDGASVAFSLAGKVGSLTFFGGTDEGGSSMNDLWRFDLADSSWTRIEIEPSPSTLNIPSGYGLVYVNRATDRTSVFPLDDRISFYYQARITGGWWAPDNLLTAYPKLID